MGTHTNHTTHSHSLQKFGNTPIRLKRFTTNTKLVLTNFLH
ncbi:hypothetical protein [Moraxella lacunata]